MHVPHHTGIFTATLAALACACALGAAACDPVDACDSNQRFSEGNCAFCPEGSSPQGGRCICDDPELEMIGGECRSPDAGTPDAGAADAPDAAAGGASDGACGEYCGFLKACLADNGVASSVASDVIAMVGLDGDDISACESDCEPSASEDAAALSCFLDAAAEASCQGDDSLDGATEALGIIDGCCDAHADSALCQRLCEAIAANGVARSLVPACQ